MIKSIRKAGLFFCFTICMMFVAPCYAAEEPDVNREERSFARAEQTRWYLRAHNGVKQKRLWSVTYGYWKTDWIVEQHAPIGKNGRLFSPKSVQKIRLLPVKRQILRKNIKAPKTGFSR